MNALIEIEKFEKDFVLPLSKNEESDKGSLSKSCDGLSIFYFSIFIILQQIPSRKTLTQELFQDYLHQIEIQIQMSQNGQTTQ